MNRILTKKFKNLVLILIGLFVLLFAFRLGYGYTLKIEDDYQESVDFDYFESGKQNYASSKYDKGDIKGNMQYDVAEVDFDGGASVDQKYEKIAEVKANSGWKGELEGTAIELDLADFYCYG